MKIWDKWKDRKIDNDAYGGFMVSKKVLEGAPVLYSYREKSAIRVFNGWTLYSGLDTEGEWYDPACFTVVSAETIAKVVPVMLKIFDAPYGTQLRWEYEKGKVVRFYDEVNGKWLSLRDFQ